MRVVRGLVIALLTAFAGCILAVFLSDYLTKLAHVPESVGFLIALAWSLLIVCGVAGLLGGVPYLPSDKPPQIDGKRLELEFELRAPATLKIPAQPDGYSIRVSLYTDNRQSDFAFIDWNGITKNAKHVTVPGNVRLLTHSKNPTSSRVDRQRAGRVPNSLT